MKLNPITRTLFIIAGTLIISLIVTFIGNILLKDGRNFFYNYVDYVYFTNLPVFLIGAIMFITESGFFNVFIYSTNKVRAKVSNQYRYTIQESESIKEEEIDGYLKEKYLYTERRYAWTYPIFIGSSLLYTTIILGIVRFYGI